MSIIVIFPKLFSSLLTCLFLNQVFHSAHYYIGAAKNANAGKTKIQLIFDFHCHYKCLEWFQTKQLLSV